MVVEDELGRLYVLRRAAPWHRLRRGQGLKVVVTPESCQLMGKPVQVVHLAEPINRECAADVIRIYPKALNWIH